MSTNVGAISATLTLEDLLTKPADRARDALGRFVKTGDDVSKKLGTTVDPSIKKTAKELENAGKKAKTTSDDFDSMVKKLAGVAAGFLTVNTAINLFQSAISAIGDSEAAVALLEARIKSTGGVAGRTSQELVAFADTLSSTIKRDDEEIIQAIAELVKFTDVAGNQYERIIKLAADMAGPTGDLVSEVERLGKAFQEPDEALTLLARSVGKFTDAEEEAIKSLAKSGDEAGAAAKMMDILEGRVGGTAEAYGKTLGGALAGIKISWENQLELLEEGLSPALKQLATDFESWLAKAENQQQVIELGHELGETLLNVVDAATKLDTVLDQISASELATILLSVIDLVAKISELKSKVEDSLGPWQRLFNNPFVEYTIISLKAIASLLGLIEGKADDLAKKPPIPKIDISGLATIPGFSLAPPGGANKPKPDHGQIDPGAIKRAEQLRLELARLEAQLKLDTDQALEMASALSSGTDEKQIDAIERAHALHNQWLQDVQKFGKSAADSLAVLRAQAYDAAQAVDATTEAFRLSQQARETRLEPFAITGGVDLQVLDDQKDVLEEIYGEQDRIARSAAAAVALYEKGAITQEQLNEYMRQFSVFWEQAPEQISAAEALMLEMGQTLASAADAGITALADGIVEAAFEGGEAWEDLGNTIESILKRMIADWLAQWFRAMAAWLQKWIATQAAARAASAALGNGGMGGGGAGAGSYAGLFQMGGMAMKSGAFGGASMGSLAAAGATVAIFAAVYFGVSKWIESHKEYAAQVTFQLREDADAAVNDIAGNSKNIKGLIDSVKDASNLVNDFLRDLGGELEGISSKVTIGSKGQGKNTSFFVQLENGVKEWFSTYEEALEAALLSALKTSDVSGFSALMQQGLKEVDTDSLEDLGEFLGNLKEISELDWTDSARQIQATVTHFLDLWASLDKLTTITPDVLISFDQLGAGIVNAFQSWFDRIEGNEKPKSREDQLAALQAEAKIANAQKHLLEARIKSEIFELEAEKRYLEARIKQVGIGAEIDGADLKHKNRLLTVRADQIQVEASLEQQRIEFINAQIAALGEILANLPKDIDIPSLRLPKIGGGGSDPFASLKDFIKDRRFELSLRGLSDYRRSLKELDREYAERMKEAKGNKKLQAELLALEKEERRQLNEEKRKQTVSDVDDFLGTKTDFDAIRDTAAKLIEDIEDSPFGDARKQRMIGRVLAGLDKQLDDLAKKSAISLFGSMLADMEKFGVDETLQAEVRKNLAILEHVLKMEHYRTEIEILRAEGRLSAEVMDLLDKSLAALEAVDPNDLFGPPANDADDKAASNYQAWAEAQDEARKKLEEEADKLADALKSATDKLKSYQDEELSPFAQRMKEINEDFDEIIKVLGNTAEVIDAYNKAVDRAKDDARDLLSGYTNDNEDPLKSIIDGIARDFEEIREALGDTPDVLGAFSDAVAKATKETYQGLVDFYDYLTGPGSSATIEQQFNAAKTELERTMSEVEAGNTAKISDLLTQGKAFEDLLGKMFGTSTGGFIEGKSNLRDRIGDILAGVGLTPVSASTGSLPLSTLTFTDSATKMISASNHIADVMQAASTRQETVLVNIRDILSDIANEIREARNTPQTLRVG